MPKTGGDITKKRILGIAEKLFSEKGFNGTSIDQMAKLAKINKATIYYHFKNKNDILLHIYRNIIEDLDNEPKSTTGDPNREESLNEKIRREIIFLSGKKNILAIMLKEALKIDNYDDFIFQCAERMIEKELGEHQRLVSTNSSLDSYNHQKFLVFEFFTGFIPIISFIVFREKWRDYFGCDDEELLDHFVNSFETSHLNSHGKLRL